MTAFAREPGELFRSVVAHEVTKTLVPVALVIGFGLGWVAFRPEFFWQDDFQNQYLPATREIARALSEGDWPILSQRCWFGAALAGEFQHGVFSLSTLAISWFVWQLGLSLPGTATALSLFHLSLVAAGAFQLARARKLDVAEATLVGVIAALNGWLIFWGKTWYPSVTSFAWVPWAWWALERALSRERRTLDVVLAGVFIYLVVAAGWPIAMLMIGVLSVCLVLRCWWVERKILALWPALVAWVIGIGLASPALLMFLEYGEATRRVAKEGEGIVLDRQWMVPLAGLRGLILPAAQTFWRGYQGNWVGRASVELAGGLVPVLALLYANYRRGGSVLRGARFDVVIAGLALLLATLPCVRPFQSSFRWLPLAHLALALVGASCLHSLRSVEGGFWASRPRLPLALFAAASIAVLTLISGAEAVDTTLTTNELGMLTFKLALAWAAFELAPRLGGWPTVGFALATLVATYHALPPLRDAPRWNMPETMRQNEPFRTDIRYLSLFDIGKLLYVVTPVDAPTYWQGGVSAMREGYTAMYSDLDFANGFSAMMPFGPTEILAFGHHGEINPYHAIHLIRVETGDGGLLDQMAIDGLALLDGYLGEVNALTAAGWHTTGRIEEATLFERRRAPSPRVRSLPGVEIVPDQDQLVLRFRMHRVGPAPLVLVGPNPGSAGFVTATLGELHEDRRHSRVQVSVPAGGGPAMVMFSRPWMPGWRATLNGQRLRVEALNMLMPAVLLPAGAQGELVIEYRPKSLMRGMWIALSTLSLSLIWLTLGARLLAWLRGLRRSPT